MKTEKRNKVIVQSRIDEEKHDVLSKAYAKKQQTFYTRIQELLDREYEELKK